jgi:hypothetical protein
MCEMCAYAETVLTGHVIKAIVDEEGIMLRFAGGRTVFLWAVDDQILVKESDLPTC